MDVLTLASAARATKTAITTYSGLDNFPQYLDADDHTRALATRDSDGSVVCVFVQGSHAGIVALLNRRNTLAAGERDARKRAADMLADADVADVEALAEIDLAAGIEHNEHIASADALAAELAPLPRVKVQPTLHVARALTHYSAIADADALACEPIDDCEPYEN